MSFERFGNLMASPRRLLLLAGAVASATLLFTSSGQTAPAPSPASVTIKLAPPNPGIFNKFKITLSGTAPARGRFGIKHNKTRLDILEQVGGRCPRTPQAELANAFALNLGPLFVRKGPFSFGQKRRSTPSPNTTIRFCAYLSTTAH